MTENDSLGNVELRFSFGNARMEVRPAGLASLCRERGRKPPSTTATAQFTVASWPGLRRGSGHALTATRTTCGARMALGPRSSAVCEFRLAIAATCANPRLRKSFSNPPSQYYREMRVLTYRDEEAGERSDLAPGGRAYRSTRSVAIDPVFAGTLITCTGRGLRFLPRQLATEAKEHWAVLWR